MTRSRSTAQTPPGCPPLYNPDFEHDACGTGFIADVSGRRSHRIVSLALEALSNLTHRGAVSADAASGDGAGVTIQTPVEMLAADARAMGLATDRSAPISSPKTIGPRRLGESVEER